MNSSSSNPNQNNNNNNHNPNNLLQKNKSTSGRKKLPMEKIKNDSNRQVTFTKRKGGLVKKASELSTLTGIEIALVVFSPSGKPYSYGNPSVERVMSRWMHANAYAHDERAPDSVMQATILNKQNEVITESEAIVNMQRHRRTELMSMETAAQLSGTFPSDLETWGYDKICTLKTSIQGFQRSVEAKVKEADIAADAKSLKAPKQDFLQRGQCSLSYIMGSSSSHVAQWNQKVPQVLNSNIIDDYANPNQGMYTQQRGGQCFANVVGSSSSNVVQQSQLQHRNQIAPEVFINNNIVNDNVINLENQGVYTGRFFNPGGFAHYNPSSLRYGGSSSFAFPSSSNVGQLASTNTMNNIEVSNGGCQFYNPKELPFDDMRFLCRHVPDLFTASPACDGKDADGLLPNKNVAGEEKSAAPDNNGPNEGNRVGDDFINELMWN